MVKEINESIFGEEVLNSEIPVVVDFGQHGADLVKCLLL